VSHHDTVPIVMYMFACGAQLPTDCAETARARETHALSAHLGARASAPGLLASLAPALARPTATRARASRHAKRNALSLL
jgi:hypothetical protein